MNTLNRSDYLSQRNNRIKHATACNVTALCMGIIQAGHKKELFAARDDWNRIHGTNYAQPEDTLMAFVNQEKYRKMAGDLITWGDKHTKKYYHDNPNELWTTLVKATNDFMGLNLVFILWDMTFEKMNEYIVDGFGLCVSGTFPKTKGHFVNIDHVGFHGVTINDPWGNYLLGYNEPVGYCIQAPFYDIKEFCMRNGKLPVFVIMPKEEI